MSERQTIAIGYALAGRGARREVSRLASLVGTDQVWRSRGLWTCVAERREK